MRLTYSRANSSLLRTVGSVEQLRSLLAENSLPTQVIEPQPVEAIEL